MCSQNQPTNHTSHQNRLFGILIIFIGSTVIGATMLMMLATLILADLVGSLLIALAILGGGFSLVAITLYLGSLRPRLHQIQNEIAQIAYIARTIQEGYTFVMEYLARFIRKFF